ncbi:MAG: YggS family pyridoxal phosphate-dependent enzyme [Actinomycetota bacterium]|nr:YggS family pyridoxal phosphate-dependent enzyme [Actinomycetota bacterium]
MQGQVTEARIRERFAEIHERVSEALRRSGRGPEEVKVLVASKYYEPAQISALAEAGVRLLGENRAQDLIRKHETFGDAFEWHFIGHLQRRKVRNVIPLVTLIHSVDSVRLIEELEKRAPESGVDVLIQLNVSGEEAKYGVREDEADRLLEAAAASEGKVRVRGLMTVAPLVEQAEDVRYVFAKLRAIRDRLSDDWSPHFDLPELSMGMSGDYEVAIEEAATLIRVGRAIIEEDGP